MQTEDNGPIPGESQVGPEPKPEPEPDGVKLQGVAMTLTEAEPESEPSQAQMAASPVTLPAKQQAPPSQTTARPRMQTSSLKGDFEIASALAPPQQMEVQEVIDVS